MSLPEYLLFAFSSLFVIMDPIATVPLFLAMTPGDTVADRARAARIASFVAAGVLLGFALAGAWILRLLGISLPAVQFAGCIVLLLIALDMLKAQPSRVRESSEETAHGAEKDDVAITPLGVPLLAGPGAMSSVILLQSKADSLEKKVGLLFVIIAVCLLAYLIFSLGARSARWLNPIALKLTERLMGLLLAAISFQFMINALRDLGLVE